MVTTRAPWKELRGPQAGRSADQRGAVHSHGSRPPSSCCAPLRGYHENLRRVFSRRRGDYSPSMRTTSAACSSTRSASASAPFSSLREQVRALLCTQNFDEYYHCIENGHTCPSTAGYKRTPEDQARWAIVLPIKNRNVRPKNYRRLHKPGSQNEKCSATKSKPSKTHGAGPRDGKRPRESRSSGAFLRRTRLAAVPQPGLPCRIPARNMRKAPEPNHQQSEPFRVIE